MQFSALMFLEMEVSRKPLHDLLTPLLSVDIGNEHGVSVVVGVPALSTLNTASAAVEQRCLVGGGIKKKKRATGNLRVLVDV